MKPRVLSMTRLSLPLAVAIAVAGLVTAPAAFADSATTVWSGTSTTDWATPGNWSSGVPTAGISALFNSGFTNSPGLSAASTSQGIWVTGATSYNAGTVTIGGAQTLAITGTATLNGIANAGILLDGTGNENLTLSAGVTSTTVTNSTSFLVNNAGTLILASPLIIPNGKVLTLGGTNSSGNILLSGSTTNTTGSLVVNTAGTVTLSGTNLNTGTTTLTAGTLKISGAAGKINSIQAVNSGATLTVDNTAGAGGILVNRLNDKNLTLTGGTFNYLSGTGTSTDNAGILAVNSGSSTINLTANSSGSTTVTASSMTHATGGTLFLTGSNLGAAAGANNANLILAADTTIAGGTGLAGTTTMTLNPYVLGRDTALSGNNQYGFMTDKINGVIQPGGLRELVLATEYANSIADAATVLTNVNLTSAITGLNSATTKINALRLDAGGSIAGSGTLTINSGGIISLDSANTISVSTLAFGSKEGIVQNVAALGLSSSITGSVGFTKSGAGTLTLSGSANLYTGTTTVNQGTLLVSGGTTLGTSATNLAVNGGILDLNGTNQTVVILSGTGGAIQNNSGAGTSTLTTSGTGACSAVIADNNGTNTGGKVALTVAGGSQTLSGTSTFSGGLLIKSGTVSLGNTSGAGTSAITLGDSSGINPATLQLNVSGGTFAYNVTVAAGSSGTLSITQPNVSGMTLNGTVALNNNLTLDFGNPGKSMTFSKKLTGTSSGSPALSIACTAGYPQFTGGVEIGSGGLTLVHNSATGSGNSFTIGTGNITSTTTGNLTIQANNVTSFTISAPSINHAGSITNSGSGSGATTLSGTLGANVTGLVQNSGTSNLILTAANSAFIGDTTLTLGTLNIRDTNALQNSVLKMNGGAVSFGNAGVLSPVALGGLSGSGNINLNDTATSPTAVALTIGNSNASYAGNTLNPTYSGVLSNTIGSASLTKVGSNTQTLAGANSYTGATIITGGTLTLGASNVIADTSAVSIGSATLDAATFTDTLGTLAATGSATIHLGAGAALAFADSSATNWTGGTLNLTGTFVSGVSLRFGTSNAGLTAGQLSSISATGLSGFGLNASGYLTASAGGGGFSSWITGTFSGNSVPGDKQGPNDDPDNDGIRNLVEYAISGGDPTRSTASPAVIAGNLVTFNKNTTATGITVSLEKSADLASWGPATPTTDNASIITYTLTPPSPTKEFVRLKVTQN